ncbi:MAG: S41 family peptidase [Chthoniobacteraceae bacterium]
MHRSALLAFVIVPWLTARAQEKPVATPVPPVESKAPAFRETVPETKPAPPKTVREAVDALPEADLKEFLNVVRDHYIAGSELTDIEVLRATVQGLLDRLSPGASILPPSPASPDEASPFRSEIIDGKVGYLRLGALSADHLGELDAALQTITSRPLGSVILDLRDTPAGSDFDLAAKVCERFCVKGKVLFTVKRPNAGQEMILTSKEDPRFAGVLVVLVDANTAGAAEVIAAVLRTQARALVIGQTTRGEAVEFSDVPLPSGQKLRVAVAEVALPENLKVFPGGVKPDVAVEVSQKVTDHLLATELERGVAPLVNETERTRMNEAALVAGTNPDLDADQAAARAKGERNSPAARDAVLQRALDAITTISLFESAGPGGRK